MVQGSPIKRDRDKKRRTRRLNWDSDDEFEGSPQPPRVPRHLKPQPPSKEPASPVYSPHPNVPKHSMRASISNGGLADAQMSELGPDAHDTHAQADEEGSDEISKFHAMMNDLGALYDQEVEQLRNEVRELRTRLSSVLTTTWSLGEDGSTLQGGALPPDYGELELLCHPSEKMPNTWSMRVKAEDRALSQLDKPSNFKARECWTRIADFTKSMSLTIADSYDKKFRSKRKHVDHTDALMAAELLDSDEGHWLVAHPNSPKRLAWDVIGLLLLVWDMVFIPISMYGSFENIFMVAMEWATLIFWTLDVAASLSTGFFHNGVCVMDPWAIAMNYLKGWFILDLFVQVPDWVITIMSLVTLKSNAANGAGVSGLLRIFRVSRCIRLLRLAKLKRIITRIKDRISSEFVFVVLSFFQILFSIIFLNHFLGSVYYLIGEMSRETSSPNWIDKLGIANQPISYRYMYSVGWSFSRFSLGSSYSDPQNNGEAMFEILTMIVGMTTFCVFTGYIGTWLHQVNNLRGEYAKQVWLLRRYLGQHNVDRDLRDRLGLYLESKCKRDEQYVNASRLTILAGLTENLRLELDYVIHYPKLVSNPMMQYFESFSLLLMHRLCGHAAKVKNFAANESLFVRGTFAAHMYVIDLGLCSYTQATWDEDVTFNPGDWFCESALWVHWACRGELAGQTECQIIMLDVKGFTEVMSAHENLKAIMSAYSEVYAEFLNEIEQEEMVDFFMGHLDIPYAEQNRRKAEQLLLTAYGRVSDLKFEDEE